jgi:class 3 adenylate cyclase
VLRCPSCHSDNEVDLRFCIDCGAALHGRCPTCGAASAGGRFCGACGAEFATGAAAQVAPAQPQRVVPTAERRVCSVLFGDLVGFTPLSESRDAEEVRELLTVYFDHCRTVVGRYGGVVEKFIGDAVMAVWGVPVAHEDDAERAVRAGLELTAVVAAMGQDVGAPGLAIRVGIVTGEVAVTIGATAEGMVAGDAVNTASRVQSVAVGGQVWVDEATRGLAAGVRFDDAGDHALKGKTDPARLWRASAVVGGVGGAQRLDGLEAPLSGRASDLRLVKELFHATEESGRPRLVVLDGEAGIGKSRLAWEFFKYIDGLSAETWWHQGRCLSYGDGVAFWALAEAVRVRFGLVEADTGEVVGHRLDARLAEFVPDLAEQEWLRPRLAVLLGAGAGAGFAREDLFAAWTTFLEHLAESGDAVVLVVDDAQHADDGLLDFIDHLLATARGAIFVMTLARPELLARRPDLGGRRSTVIRLEPLGEPAMTELVDGLVADLPAVTRNALVARAEGVPLFAVETVRALVDRDLVVAHDGRYVPAEGVTLDLEVIGAPASLHALVAARLDALSDHERRVVADASVLGASFTRQGLVALGSEPHSLDGALSSLMRRQIVAVQSDRFSADRGHFRFVQSAVRQVAYATQSKRDRKARHIAAADHLAGQPDPTDDLAVVIAQHLLDAAGSASVTDSDVGELTNRALDYLERAASRARAVGAPGDAHRLIETALAHAYDPASVARLHLAAAHAAGDAAHFPDARDHARTATELFDALAEQIQAGLAAGAQSLMLVRLGENAAAIEVAEPRCQELAEVPGAEAALLALSQSLQTAYAGLGAWESQRHFNERSLLLAEALNDASALSHAHNSMGIRYAAIGAPATERFSYQTAVGIARDHDLPGPLAVALLNLAALSNSHDLPTALDYAREAIEVSRRSGFRGHLDTATNNYLVGLWTAGQLGEVSVVLTESLNNMSSFLARFTALGLESWLADACGQPIPEPTPEDAAATDVRAVQAWVDTAHITRALATGDPAEAARIAAISIDTVIAAMGIDDDFMVLWPPLVQAALANHDVELAARLLAPVTEAQPGRVSPAVAAQWHRLRGLVAAARGDDPSDVEAELRAGIDALEAFGAVGYRAQAQEEFGRWLIGQGLPGDAEPLLDAARATYLAIGATGWLRRLDTHHPPSST